MPGKIKRDQNILSTNGETKLIVLTAQWNSSMKNPFLTKTPH